MFKRIVFTLLIVMSFVGLVACAGAPAAGTPAVTSATVPVQPTAAAPKAATAAPTAAATNAIAPTAAAASGSAAGNRTVTDMAGRQVTLPPTISRIATVGSVPVMNGFMFALGEGEKLVNGLPPSMSTPSWKYQYVFVPALKDLPKIENSDRSLNIEELLKVRPDVVFTMDLTTVKTVENAKLNVVYLSWTQPEDVKKLMSLLGEIFNKQARAAAYVQYFDDTISRVNALVKDIPEEKKVRVLYGAISSLSNPHLISEWWIASAGGSSVTKSIHTGTTESVTFDAEQLVKWDPQVMILSTPADLQLVSTDARFAQISAVKSKQIYICPKGAHLWGNRTIEQPLTVLWTAKTAYPDVLKSVDINAEIKNFYAKIFGFTINDQQVGEILGGNITSY